MVSIVVPGEPVPQARPRVTRHGTYDPPKCVAYKCVVRLFARHSMDGKEPISGPIECRAKVYRGIPKSWSRRKREAAQEGYVLPTTKPDTDNYLKGLMDAMHGIVWNDDSQVIRVMCEKHYSDDPRVEIEIRNM